MRCPCSSLAKLLHSDKVRTRWDGTPEGYWPCHTEVPQIDEQVLRFRRAEEGSCDGQVCDLLSQKVWNDQLSPLFITTSKTWQLQNKFLSYYY